MREVNYINENEFSGYITRGIFGRWRVLVTGQGVACYETPITFSAWSRENAIARADRWCRRQARVRQDEPYRFDPIS